ncbi:MAG: carboxypeptidase regulatory-like domain-containing protein [Candidatus Krumholzibacteria bacterium]
MFKFSCVLLVMLPSAVVFGLSRVEARPRKDFAPEQPGKNRTEEGRNVRFSGALESTGKIEGAVRFIGQTIPHTTMVPVGTDRQYCGPEHSKEDYVIDAATRGVRYVIVRLKGKELRNWQHTKPKHLVLDNKNCRFDPHAAVLTVGSTVEIHNSDKISHTAHAYFAASFNVALVREGHSVKQVLNMPGLILIRCDTHGWMNAFIRVDPHPFHAVSDARGHFEIANVPPGTYTLEAWHERFGVQNTEVVVQAERTAKVDLTYDDR